MRLKWCLASVSERTFASLPSKGEKNQWDFSEKFNPLPSCAGDVGHVSPLTFPAFVCNSATSNDASPWTLKVTRDVSRKTVEPQGFSGIIARGAQCPGERGEQNAERIREEIIGWLDNRGTGALAFSLNSRGDILLEKNVLFFFTFYPLSLFASICPLLLFPENARRILCVCVSLCVFVCMPFPPTTVTAALLQR